MGMPKNSLWFKQLVACFEFPRWHEGLYIAEWAASNIVPLLEEVGSCASHTEGGITTGRD